MSDDQQPSIFGGLPPRAAAAPVTAVTPVSGGLDPKRLRLAIIIASAVAAVCIIVLIVILVGNATTSASARAREQQHQQSVAKSIAVDAAKDKAKADAVIAKGGGAVKGHVVSAELCKALDAFVAAGGDAAASQKISPALLTATEGLAAVTSPNQPVYQKYVKLQKDPASIPSIAEAQAASADFVKAAQADLVTCM